MSQGKTEQCYVLLEATSVDGGWRFEIELPQSSRYFDGHFDGDPVLPAIAQLDIVTTLLREVDPELIRPAAIETLRLQAPVAPGSRLTVSASTVDELGRSRFELSGNATTITQGALRWETRRP